MGIPENRLSVGRRFFPKKRRRKFLQAIDKTMVNYYDLYIIVV